ncbi:MAG: hypothetical protein JST00_01140 [Deltaproteobacteria bacterium]|nr:hypothetical protein [Deltaproteobacteria bacterium]
MARKIFTVAAISAVTGAVLVSAGGCGGTTIIYTEAGPVGDATPDRVQIDEDADPPDLPDAKPRDDAGPDAVADATSDAKTDSSTGGQCPVTTPIDATTFPWKPPAVTPGACSEADLNAFITYVAKTDDPQKWKLGIANGTCASCVFGPDGATWPPMVENAAGMLQLLNIGGCIAVASGIEACGRGYQQWRDCYIEACADCIDDSATYNKCITAANKGACKKAFDDVILGCGSAQVAGDAETACDGNQYVFEGPIRAQCIGL